MKNSKFKNPIYKLAFGAGLALVSTATIAQNQMQSTKVGMVFTSSPKECAMACSSDILCAAWVFTPVKIGASTAVAGQCNFSNNTNISTPSGSSMGYPLRRAVDPANYATPYSSANTNYVSNIANNAPKNTNLYQGNYGVKPLNSAPVAQNTPVQLAYVAPPPAPLPSVQQQNAQIQFQRPNNAPPVNYAPPVTYAPPVNYAPPVTQYQAQPTYQAAPMPQAPIVQPSIAQAPHVEAPKQVASNSPTSLGRSYSIQSDPTQFNVENKETKTYGPLRANKDMQKFIGKDGMIDAAAMRRAQIHENGGNNAGYSVQKEWSEVAQSVANGTNNPSYDYANTTPIAVPKDNNNSNQNNYMNESGTDTANTQTKPKNGFFSLFTKKPANENNGEPSSDKVEQGNSGGPLRRH